MWNIYDKTGNDIRCTIKALEYSGTWMGAGFVTSTIKSEEPIPFEIGDYLIYRGEKFEINYDPTALKKATRRTSGEAFVYDSVKFNNASDELTRCDFLDFVKHDNQVHFTSLPKFSFFASSVQDLADRVQVNLDRIYTGDKKWTVIVHPEHVNTTNVNIDIDNIKVWGAVELFNSKFGATLIIRGRTITVGTAGIAVDGIFTYGRGNGLYEIQRTADSDQNIITRLRAYGSSKNLPNRYYNKLTDSSLSNFLPNNMAVMNLMLPGFPENTLDPYIDSENITELGIRESSIYFDGTGELEEIYPSMQGMTAQQMIDAGISISIDAGDNGNLDEVFSAEQLTDDGTMDDLEEGKEPPPFTITLKDIGFNINDYLIAETATISMTDGTCGGREFEITKCEKQGNKYVLTCNRVYDDGLKLYFPYNNYNIKSGDKFVLLQIDMPDVYIKAASQRLLVVAKEYLAKVDYVRYSYEPKVDDIFMARQHKEATERGEPSIHDTIKEGDFMMFEDADLGIDGSIIIDTLIIKEGEDMIPKYTITLRDEKVVGSLDKMQNQIDSISKGQGGGGLTTQQIQSIIQAFGSKKFLRKDQEDVAAKHISFEEGITVKNGISTDSLTASNGIDVKNGVTTDTLSASANVSSPTATISDKTTTLNLLVQAVADIYDLNVSHVATLFRTTIKDYISSELYTSGLTGSGMKLYKALNGDWNLELDNVVIRKAMTVFELIISKIRAVNGGLVISPANGKVKSVLLTNGIYRLEIEGDMMFVADDLVRCQTFTKTGSKYYWVRITSVSGAYAFVNATEFTTSLPTVGDDLVQFGNKTNALRQGIIYLTASEDGKPRISVLDGVNSTDLTGKTKVILGCLDGVVDSDFPADTQPSGYGLYAQNVFLKGLFILRNGKSVESEITATNDAVQTAQSVADAAQTSANNAKTEAEKVHTEYKSDFSVLSGKVESKVSQTDFNALGNRVSSAESSITQLPNQIALSVTESKQYTDGKVDAVQVGGRNLLPNSDFSKTDLSRWSKSSDGNYTISIANGELMVVGTQARTASELNSSWSTAWNVRPYSFNEDSEYTLSFEAYALVECVLYCRANYFLYPANGGSAEIGTTKKKYSIVFKNKPYDGDTRSLGFVFSKATTLFIDNVKLEIGNKPTDWSPAPEDVDAEITTAKTAASAAQTTANQAKTDASTAQTAANNAQSSANTANNLLTDIANDNKLTANEKQETQREWDVIMSEKVKNDASADKFGVSKAAYGTAYTALNTYITPLLASLTTTSNITGTDFRVKFKAYYDARTDLLNAISVKAKDLADAAQTAANNAKTEAEKVRTEYTSDFSILSGKVESKVSQTDFNALGSRVSSAESSITQLPNQIALSVTESKQYTDGKVDSVQVGGRNLLPNSDFSNSDLSRWSKSSDNNYTISIVNGELMVVGTQARTSSELNSWSTAWYVRPYSFNEDSEYTLSFEAYALAECVLFFRANYFLYPVNGGSAEIGTTKKKYSIVFKNKPYDGNRLLGFVFSKATTLFIDNVKLELGNKPTDWTPAPEDVDAEITTAKTAASAAQTAANNAKTEAEKVRTEYTSDFSILSGKVESKVSQTDFNALGNRVSSAESSITQLPNQIALSVTESKQYTDGKVDAVQAGGRNLFPMTKLRAIYFNNGSVQIGTGADAIFSAKGTGWTIYPIALATPIIPPNTDFIVSFEVRNTQAGFGFEITSISGTDTIIEHRVFKNPTNEWVRMSSKYNSGSSAIIGGINLFNQGDIRRIKFEKGTIPTDWSPAPEDVDAEIALRPTTDQIKAEFTIDPTGISMLGKKIALTGMVTFTALDASAQATINSKATGNDIATKLGYSNYTDMINKATAGKTIINGGYINTNLVKADEIVTQMLLCRDSDGNIVSAVNREGDGAFRTYYANGQMQMEFRPTETNGVIASYSPTGLLNWKIGAGANFITNNIDSWDEVFLYPTTTTGSGVLNTTFLVGTKYLHYQAASGSPLSSYSGLTMKGTYSNSISPDKVTVQMMITNGWYTYAGPPHADMTEIDQPSRYARTLMRYANGYIVERKEVVFDA